MKLAALALLIAVAVTGAVRAQSLDCNTLKTTSVPFAIDHRFKGTNKDGSPMASSPQQRTQIVRGPGETLAYTVPSPGHFIRTRSKYELFPIDLYFGTTGEVRRWSYSIDTSIDPLIEKKPLTYHAELRAGDGKVLVSADMTATFVGNANLDVQGCRFDLVKIARTARGTALDKRMNYDTELWLSSELRTALFSRIESFGSTGTHTATAITLDFERLEPAR